MMPKTGGGSAARWGPLFGARAAAWAETWEGAEGWRTPVYGHVLVRAEGRPGDVRPLNEATPWRNARADERRRDISGGGGI